VFGGSINIIDSFDFFFFSKLGGLDQIICLKGKIEDFFCD